MHLEVGANDEMIATAAHEGIAKTMQRYPNPNADKTEVDSIHQWSANLMPDKIVYDTVAGKFVDPF